MDRKTPEEIQQAIKDQKELCDRDKLPHFAPHDGRCFDCGNNIYQNLNRPGWDGKSLVTG